MTEIKASEAATVGRMAGVLRGTVRRTVLTLAVLTSVGGVRAGTERTDRPKVDLSGYRIVWRDEFDGDRIDASKWAAPSMERQGASLWHPRNVSVKDGAAVFRIRKTNDPKLRYESACLRTTRSYDPGDRLYAFTRGYVEARCRLPKHLASDYWFALWMMVGEVSERNPDTRKGCEVDVMETFHVGENGRMPHTFHWNGYGQRHNSYGHTVRDNPELLDGGWHTFGCLWTEDSMSFTIDGRVTWKTDLKGLGEDKPGKTKSQGVPQVPGYIKLSVEAASWAGPHGDRWEDPMPEEDEVLVDWVRVWQR